MSAPIEPRVRYQAQFFHPRIKEWCDTGVGQPSIEHADFAIGEIVKMRNKIRILKATTTFEVVEEMEPKQ